MTVLDASAVLAPVHDEPGADVVSDELIPAVLGAANLAEVIGKLVDAEVDVGRVRGLLTAAAVTSEPVLEEDAELAGAMRALPGEPCRSGPVLPGARTTQYTGGGPDRRQRVGRPGSPGSRAPLPLAVPTGAVPVVAAGAARNRRPARRGGAVALRVVGAPTARVLPDSQPVTDGLCVGTPTDVEDVRSSYDRVADAYVALGIGDLGPDPWLRAALVAFAEQVEALGPVLDVGCGPGTVTAYLAGLGLDVSGVDLSSRMVDHARRLHPGQRFAVASATDLRLAPASLGGVLGWWSLFNLPRAVLPGVLASFARALVPGGQVLIGTHVGDGDVVRTEAYGGVPVSWTTHLWRPEQLLDLVVAAGLEPVAELRFPTLPPADRPQVLVAARRSR